MTFKINRFSFHKFNFVDSVKFISFFRALFLKTSWCFQHFLTMEFYRKICNKCYWSSVYSSRQSFVKKILILTVSVVSLMFLSFFYMPTDPANSDNSSYYIRIKNFYTGIILSFKNNLINISNQIIVFSSSVINLQKINLLRCEVYKLNSALLI